VPSSEPPTDRPPGFIESVLAAFRSRRVASVTLLSFSSGLPLGLVWIAIPDWMRSSGVDIRIVGLFTLAQAPWTFKILWSPLMDRYVPPFWGRRRGWMAIAQIALLVLTLALAGVGHQPETPWIVLALTFAIAFASATQDIAYDAYAVEVLRKDEQGVAVGLKTATYRAAMLAAGALSITAAAYLSWPVVCVGLALLYVPVLFVTKKAPEPSKSIAAPRTLREAVWLPFLGFLGRHRALEILAFVFSYKLADALSQSLLRPFLSDMGYSAVDRGAGFGLFGTASTLVGTFLGGALVPVLGLGHCLWIFGFLQIFSNLGYILLAHSEVNRPLMYGAMGFETFTTGLGIGAFSVFLLRITQKRFSATQYALFSSLFGLPRILGGPVTGFIVHSAGWSTFFWFTIVAGIPGLLLLARFSPPGVRDPVIELETTKKRAPLSTAGLTARGLLGGLGGLVVAGVSVAALDALEGLRDDPDAGFSLSDSVGSMLRPEGVADWLLLAGVLVFALICGLFTAAVAAARRESGSLEET
jgi:PAT family beta-lactamase induction signal transducer AmpG